ncbi:MAG TPA: hypothetical protein VHY34_02570 [Caulobacteraceae bacterium]|nr:hypothetical protein [Caulobacteraceae bacterium]
MRADRLTRELPHEMVGRIFGFSFALEQLRSNLRDLADRTDEFARPGAAGVD